MTKWYPPRVLHLLDDAGQRLCEVDLADTVPLWKKLSVFSHFISIHKKYPLKSGQTICPDCESIFYVASL